MDSFKDKVRKTHHSLPAISLANKVLFVAGMAMFFSTSITLSMAPPLFFAYDPVNSEASASAVLLLSLIVCALLYLLLRAYRKTTRRRELVWLVVALTADTLVKIVLLLIPLDPQAYSAIRWVYLVLVAPMLICLSIIWAGACDYFDGRELRILIPLAMLFSVFVGVGSRMLGSALSLDSGVMQSFLSLGSGLVGIVLTQRRLVASRIEHDESVEEYEVFEEFHPTGEIKGARSLLAAWIALWLFLLGTSMFIGYYSQGFKLDALQGSGHILTVFLLACGMIVIARLAEKHLLKFQVFIVVFIGLCLIALYVTAAMGVTRPELTKSVLLPVRACAIIFSWLILEEFCRECNRPFAPVATVTYFPLVIASTLLAIVFGTALGGKEAALFDAHDSVMALCLTTAFLVTVSSFSVVRYGWGGGSDAGEGAFGATRDAASLGAREPIVPSQEEWPADGGGSRWLVSPSDADGCGAGGAGEGVAEEPAHAPSRDVITESRALEILRFRYKLTNREFDVLRLTMRGHTQKGMADELYLSINSVSTYVKALHAKMNVHSRQEIVDLVHSLISE